MMGMFLIMIVLVRLRRGFRLGGELLLILRILLIRFVCLLVDLLVLIIFYFVDRLILLVGRFR